MMRGPQAKPGFSLGCTFFLKKVDDLFFSRRPVNAG